MKQNEYQCKYTYVNRQYIQSKVHILIDEHSQEEELTYWELKGHTAQSQGVHLD
jgi:hypothetical protein